MTDTVSGVMDKVIVMSQMFATLTESAVVIIFVKDSWFWEGVADHKSVLLPLSMSVAFLSASLLLFQAESPARQIAGI